MGWFAWFSRRHVVLALKAAVVTGLAYFLGSLLPAPIDDYNYYAALGAFTVVGLIVVDSIKESLRVFGAVVVGVLAAVAVQSIAWTNPLTVALTILACVLVAGVLPLGKQRTWAPLAALFVLATGGADPEPMVVGYLIQVPLGAVIGVFVNLVLLAPLGDEDLEQSTEQMFGLLAGTMHRYATFLSDASDPEAEVRMGEDRDTALGINDWELTQAQWQLRAAITEGRKAQEGNPRARGHRQRDELLLQRADAASHCAVALSSMAVDLKQSDPGEGQAGLVLRRRAAEALRHTARVFEAPDRARADPAFVAARDSIELLLEQVRSMATSQGLDHVLFGALAITINRCLELFDGQLVGADNDDLDRDQ